LIVRILQYYILNIFIIITSEEKCVFELKYFFLMKAFIFCTFQFISAKLLFKNPLKRNLIFFSKLKTLPFPTIGYSFFVDVLSLFPLKLIICFPLRISQFIFHRCFLQYNFFFKFSDCDFNSSFKQF